MVPALSVVPRAINSASGVTVEVTSVVPVVVRVVTVPMSILTSPPSAKTSMMSLPVVPVVVVVKVSAPQVETATDQSTTVDTCPQKKASLNICKVAASATASEEYVVRHRAAESLFRVTPNAKSETTDCNDPSFAERLPNPTVAPIRTFGANPKLLDSAVDPFVVPGVCVTIFAETPAMRMTVA